MESNNKLINNKELSKKKDNIANFRKIRNKYILQQIFEHLNQKKFLKVIKHNKNIQNKLDINQNHYKTYCDIEIEIIPTEDYHTKEPFINFNNKEEESYYHIYYNDRKEETKRINRNYFKIVNVLNQ